SPSAGPCTWRRLPPCTRSITYCWRGSKPRPTASRKSPRRGVESLTASVRLDAGTGVAVGGGGGAAVGRLAATGALVGATVGVGVGCGVGLGLGSEDGGS